MRPLHWQVRAMSDPRYVDTVILRLAWTLQALDEAEVATARALVAGLHDEWAHLRDHYTWQLTRKEARS
jgi:hypothetical protein